jgi:hypothetical protein
VAAAAILGGLTWIPIRIAISVTFSRPLLDLTYVEWNKLMVVPLGLLLVAMIGVAGLAASRAARVGAWVAVTGLVGMLAGSRRPSVTRCSRPTRRSSVSGGLESALRRCCALARTRCRSRAGSDEPSVSDNESVIIRGGCEKPLRRAPGGCSGTPAGVPD